MYMHVLGAVPLWTRRQNNGRSRLKGVERTDSGVGSICGLGGPKYMNQNFNNITTMTKTDTRINLIIFVKKCLSSLISLNKFLSNFPFTAIFYIGLLHV